MTQSTTPKLVNWLGYLAITLLLALPIAVFTARAGIWQQGLLLFAISCLGAAVLLVLAIIMLLLPRFAPWRRAILTRAARIRSFAAQAPGPSKCREVAKWESSQARSRW
jgi:hypothetical protein